MLNRNKKGDKIINTEAGVYEYSGWLSGSEMLFRPWASGDITVQGYDGHKWSAPTKIHFDVAPPTDTANSMDFSPGKTYTLRELTSIIKRDWFSMNGDSPSIYEWVADVYVKDPAGAGSLNLNGAPIPPYGALPGYVYDEGEAVIRKEYLDQVTYTCNGTEKLEIGLIEKGWPFPREPDTTIISRDSYVDGLLPMERHEIEIGGAPVGAVAAQPLGEGQSTALTNLVSFSDPNGDTVKYYQVIDPEGAGSLQLNGAVNRTGDADMAAGKYQFTAKDFAKLIYWNNGAETLTVQAFDGQMWSDPTQVVVADGGVTGGSASLFGVGNRPAV